MSDGPDLLILGLGNVLCADDGLGVAAVTHLARDWTLPVGVTALDGGTLGLSLLGLLESAPDVILVDAVRGDGPPGTLVRLAGDDVLPAALERLSSHQIGVADLLQAMRLRARMPRRLVLWGLVPESLELRLGRSPAVEAALPGLVEHVVMEADRLGYRLERHPVHDATAHRDARDLARVLGL